MDRICGDGVRAAHPLFQAEGGGSIPTSPLQLYIERMPKRVAVELNEQWHSRLPIITNWQGCIAFGASFENVYYAVALWGNPVVRLLLKKSHPHLKRLISYQDTSVHTGTIYKAAGWKAIGFRRADEWSCPARKAAPTQALADKIRWEISA